MNTKLTEETEEKIKEIALGYAKQGRPERDVLHVPAVVFYMKQIISKEGGNERVLVPAAWLHDIGYAGLLDEGYSNEDNEAVKDMHMKVGADMAREDLVDVDELSEDEVAEICRLISIHDDLDAIEGKNSQLLFEADTLGMIDIDRVPPNFSRDEFKNWMETDFNPRRAPQVKTDTGKKYLSQLLEKVDNHLAYC